MLGTTAFALFNNLGGRVMLAGMGMLGASMLRNRAVPRWIACLTLAGMVGFFPRLPAAWGILRVPYEAPPGIAVATLGALMIRRPRGLRRWFHRV